MEHCPLLSAAYLPPVEYFAFLAGGKACIESRENYVRQSYRNRTRILTGNGPLSLSVPVVHREGKTPIRDVRIEYRTPWQKTHWRTLTAAYGGSPFFLYYQDALQPFYEKRHEFLFDFDLEITHTLLRLLHFTPDLELTADFGTPCGRPDDLRTAISPKNALKDGYRFKMTEPYYQTFGDRSGFVPNLSVIDLLANTGNGAAEYIRNFCTFAFI